LISARHATCGAAALRAQQIRLGNGQVVPRDGDLQIVFQGKRNSVIERQRQLPSAIRF
jgi:hypothetical protein